MAMARVELEDALVEVKRREDHFIRTANFAGAVEDDPLTSCFEIKEAMMANLVRFTALQEVGKNNIDQKPPKNIDQNYSTCVPGWQQPPLTRASVQGSPLWVGQPGQMSRGWC